MNEFIKNDIKTTDIAPFSVRVTDDIKAKLKQLQEESGSTQPDFYRSLVALYVAHNGQHEARTQEEEDISNALSVISHSTNALLNRLADQRKTYKHSTERYAADVDDTNEKIAEMLRDKVALTTDLEEIRVMNQDLQEQLVTMKKETQLQIEKIKHQSVKEAESISNDFEKKIKNLQAVADTIGEIKSQAQYAKIAQQRAEENLQQSLTITQQEQEKTASLETANRELQVRLQASQTEMNRLESELTITKKELTTLTSQLSCEIIGKNRAEAKLEILEPQLSRLNHELLTLRTNQVD